MERSRIQPIHAGLEALDDGFGMVDQDWRVIYWNAAAETMLGVDRASVLGQDLWSALPFLRESSSHEMLQRAQRTRTALRYLEPSPGHFPGCISVHAAPVEDGGLAIHFRDATEEVKQAEHYSALLESIQNGFVAVDEEWRVVYVNAAAESLLRVRRERARGVSLWSFLPRRPEQIGECLRATMADGARRHLTGVSPHGRVFRRRIYDLWTYPLAGGGISILFEDVSDRVKHEQTLTKLAREAQEANEAKSRFFAAISHELRTPLNAIVGYTHLLETGTYGHLPEPALRAACRAGVCAEHLSRLVDDLLLLTASEVDRLEVSLASTDVVPLLEGATEPYRHQAEAKRLSFDLQFEPDLPEVETDRDRLRQLVTALLSNAVKYTSRGGIIVAVRRIADEVEISVSDTGPGIRPADRDKIFAPFEQLGDAARSNPLERGVGMGLTVSRQLATLLRGRLFLDDDVRQGARFCLRLPITWPLGDGSVI